MTAIWWIRRDIRLTDKAALHAALEPSDQAQDKAGSAYPFLSLSRPFLMPPRAEEIFAWTAGTGTDAAPYFRIFSPVLQSRKFDRNGAYIPKWLSELRELVASDIHAPWEKKIKIKGYPEQPIVKCDKERTLRAYKLSKEGIKA
jgi:deoxyribodipyrimidine photolyase